MKIAIEVLGYNRDVSINRLLNYLKSCDYCGDTVDIIISIDNGGNDKVYDICKSFKWEYGEKILIFHEKRIGLRNNVLFCGNLVENYDAIIMFEDDIIPSKYFYTFAKEALIYYKDSPKVAGISLYQHRWNVGCRQEFIPDFDINSDIYFMQYAQSWGQAWTKRMWSDFYQWYQMNSNRFDVDYLPQNVVNWPESSWLKYFIKYVVDEKKYFVYPKYSLSTNCSDQGTHNASHSYSYQVPLLATKPQQYQFTSFEESSTRYDSFYEREEIAEWLNIDSDNLCIDLYGMKNNFNKKRYWLTLDQKDYKIIRKFSLCLKPIELNIKHDMVGNDIYLYDTNIIEKKLDVKKSSQVEMDKILFSTRDIGTRNLKKLFFYKFKESLKNKIKR